MLCGWIVPLVWTVLQTFSQVQADESPPGPPPCGRWTPQIQKSQPSLFVYWASGRLAARMTPYSILLCLKLKHKMKIAIDRATVDSLNKYFLLPSLDKFEILEDSYCEDDIENMKKHMELYTENNNEPQKLEPDLIGMRHGRVVNVFPAGTLASASYWIPDKLVAGFSNILKHEFRFKAEYVKYAQDVINQVNKARKSGKSREVVFVGLHARRTDYKEYSKTVLKKSIVGKSYYKDAMESFREDFPSSDVFFLAVSDDLDWVRRSLGSSPGLVVVGSQDQSMDNRVGQDLALLANCNHTIMSSGVYGLWGAFLASGDTHTEYGILASSVMGGQLKE